MVGHAMLAFAFFTLGARTLGSDRDHALALGVIAGGFAAVPDVDMAYAVVGATQSQLFNVWAVTEAFWRSSQAVHRTITHSLVIAIPAALAFAVSTVGTGNRPIERPRSEWFRSISRMTGGAVLVGLIAIALVQNGVLGAIVMSLFILTGLVVAIFARYVFDLTTRAVFTTALVGLASHPFGDVLTGSPPAFFYPLDSTLVAERLTLMADPTLNLLAIFGVEIATLWMAAIVFFDLTDRRLSRHIDVRATFGAAYAVAVFVLPAPTLSVSYHFVFSVLAVGVIGVTPRSLPRPERQFPPSTFTRPTREDVLTATLTALAAISLAVSAYTVAYLTRSSLTQPFF